mgnify:CR=1 FL=1
MKVFASFFKKKFFFEKKNQKTFIRLGAAQMDRSLFASFSSEKEESCLLKLRHPPRHLQHPPQPQRRRGIFA